jgi:hypothetical protein
MATNNLKEGDYCLATKWSDGEAWDHWAVGFYGGCTPHGRFIIVDEQGISFRAGGFRRCSQITQEQGDYLLSNALELERAGTCLWGLIEDRRLWEKGPQPWSLEKPRKDDETGSGNDDDNGKVKEDLSQISDGFHTFEELYEHRHSLVLALMALEPELFWFSRRHSDGSLCFGDGNWFIVGADLPGVGPISYHLPIELWTLAENTEAKCLHKGRPWDGHTSNDVSSRIRLWAELHPSQGHL